jgi:hypothetical protein
MPPDPRDVRVMIPRVRRALDGPQALTSGFVGGLSDEQVKNYIADAVASVIFYTGGVFGAALEVTERDPDYGAPSEYATSRELTLPEQTVIAVQASLDHFQFTFKGAKVSEAVQNEFQSWDWTINGPMLRDQLKSLLAQRDEALELIRRQGSVGVDTYASFLAAQDVQVALAVEPYTVYDTGGYMPTRGGNYGGGGGGIGSSWDGDGLGGLGLFGP